MKETVATCSHCGHQTNGFIRICPICGGEIVKEAVTRQPVCPRCGVGLEKCDYNGHQLEKCTECSGLWIHDHDFEVLTSERDVYRDDAVPTEFVRKPPPLEEGYLPCACCGNRMNRLNFKTISGVVIDWCRDCGWWLDAGEIESIRAFIAAGGLDKAQDSEILKAKDEIQNLTGRVDDLELMQKILHRWNLKRWLFGRF
jgi:Zn-finger nucleic acid-binding protein